jgi:acetoin utilization deacetylase AcuC-like enzyme
MKFANYTRELKVSFRKEYNFTLPENHRFPMEKYDLLPKQLLHEGTLTQDQFITPEIPDDQLLTTVHDIGYIKRLTSFELSKHEERATGFVHSNQLIEREKLIMEGTRLASERALTCGAAMNIAGGTHHAFKDRGEGFCLLNDQVIAADWLLKKKGIGQILIIDLDVHQGNGTAKMCQEIDKVFTFSMHGKNNYPLHKEQSDLDVELDDGTSDDVYLYELEKNLNDILERYTPDFVFYQCGVDILSSDKLGRLDVSINGCKERDRKVFQSVKQLNVPIVCTMGGGYSAELTTITEAHANTFRSIQDILF